VVQPITMAARSKANRLLPLEHWVHEFESHSRHGCLCAFIVCIVVCVGSGLAPG
jgi:hypothetical protein